MFVSSRIYFFLILIKLLRQLMKIVFPCSEIPPPCFVKSLGLDITSVILTSFKMAATYLLFFVIYFYGKEIWRIDSFVIHFTLKKCSKFRQILLYFILNSNSNLSLSIYILRIYLQSRSHLFIVTNPRFPPR